MLFINSNKIEWTNDPNYLHWSLEKSSQMFLILKMNLKYRRNPSKIQKIQTELFQDTFDISNEISSSKRAANEINQFINE